MPLFVWSRASDFYHFMSDLKVLHVLQSIVPEFNHTKGCPGEEKKAPKELTADIVASPDIIQIL